MGMNGSLGALGFKLVLCISLAATVAFASIIYMQQAGQISQLSSDLASRNSLIDQQAKHIKEQSSLVASQQQEISDKTAQLETLQDRVDELSEDIDSIEEVLAEKTEQAASLQDELERRAEELEDLQSQITLLQAELQEKDEDIAELILEKASERVHVEYYGLGVDEDGDGIVFPIEVEVLKSGDNRISLDVSNVQYTAAFQSTVRTAVEVASDYTGISVSDKDIIVRLVNRSNSVIKVDGPSAGAVIAAIIVAGLEEKELDADVLVTGTIESDGTIGEVGGLTSKADAAAEFGANRLLVPSGQEFPHDDIRIESVEDIGDLARRIIVD